MKSNVCATRGHAKQEDEALFFAHPFGKKRESPRNTAPCFNDDPPCRALDNNVSHFYDGKHMEVDFTPDLEAKLDRLAAEQGRDAKALVREAVERLVNYDEWFIREVEKGLAAADRGEFIEHEEIGKLIDRRYPG